MLPYHHREYILWASKKMRIYGVVGKDSAVEKSHSEEDIGLVL